VISRLNLQKNISSDELSVLHYVHFYENVFNSSHRSFYRELQLILNSCLKFIESCLRTHWLSVVCTRNHDVLSGEMSFILSQQPPSFESQKPIPAFDVRDIYLLFASSACAVFHLNYPKVQCFV
jgi:hypothetical protein